jgi:hypothetical protein
MLLGSWGETSHFVPRPRKQDNGVGEAAVIGPDFVGKDELLWKDRCHASSDMP